MRAVVQRVREARVLVAERQIASIGAGLCVLLGVADGDCERDAERLARKVALLRIFENEAGRFDNSVVDVGGAALVVSQFTLIAETAKGNRPSFAHAARPELAEPLYEHFCARLAEHGVTVSRRSLRRPHARADRERRSGHDHPRCMSHDLAGGACYPFGRHHKFQALESGRSAPAFCERARKEHRERKGVVNQVHQRERELQREVETAISAAAPDVEVLAVELVGPERFCVFIDHPDGVDLALCERVSGFLRGYSDRYTVDVSSPGFSRPLRRREHFERASGQRVTVRTAQEIEGRKRFKGEVAEARDDALALRLANGDVEIPYAAIVRGNLIDEGRST